MDNSTPDMSERLVLYLDGELTGAEKTQIEQQLAVNAVLLGELDSLRSARAAIMFYGLQQKVAGIHREMMEELKTPVRKISAARSPRKMLRYSMGIAAGLLLLIGGFMAYNFLTLSSDKVFASRYHSYELVTTRDGNTPETPAEKAFREKNYREVIRIHDKKEDRSQKAEFLCGVSALEIKDNTKAIECLKEVIAANKTSAKPVLNDEAEYYLALGYIRNRDYDYALDILNTIREDPDHIYHGAVTAKLLRQVKLLKWR
jgi:tetratricopeptide (TPR) repeat protein